MKMNQTDVFKKEVKENIIRQGAESTSIKCYNELDQNN